MKQDPVRNPLLVVQLVLIGMLLVALTLSAIADRGTPATGATVVVEATDTQAGLEAAASDTHTSEPVGSNAADTPTPENTATPADTPTPPASDTPWPTPTRPEQPTQPPEPIVRTGSGDSVFYPQKWIGPAVVHITHDGSGFFLVWTQNENAQREVQLVNTVGPYQGNSLIDYLGNQRTSRLEVRTGGSWHIEVLPLSSARRGPIPGMITGSGDDVVLFDGSRVPDRLNADASTAWGSFTVWAYGDPPHLMINSAAPYTGTMVLPPSTTALAVKAIGPWSIEVTTK